jgi:hypothetical protein
MKAKDVPGDWVEAGAIELCWVGFHQPLPGKTAKSYWRNVSATAKQQYQREVRAALAAVAPLIRRAALEEAARVARNGCLVPPDGGSPTEAEADMCDRIAATIRALDT